MRSLVAASVVLLALGACSTLTEGTSQTLSIESNPPGAECEPHRKEMLIGKVTTPGSLLVQKTRDDITVTCRKEGYNDAKIPLPYDMAVSTLGNIILGGGIGLIVDAASNSSIKYAPVTSVTLVANTAAATANPTAAGGVSAGGVQTASATVSEAKAAVQPAPAKPFDTEAVKKLVQQHFDANRDTYANYIETNSVDSLRARNVVVLEQSPGTDGRSWNLLVRIDGERTVSITQAALPNFGFSQTFRYRTEEKDGAVRIAEWRKF